MIVNHTWNHRNLRYMSAAGVRDEIAQATDAIHAATGERPGMFRAPYGVWPPVVFSYCAQAGLTPLAWSVDPRDWSRPGVRAIVRTIVSDTRTGSVILEHDGWEPVADRGGAEDLAAPAARRGLPVHHPLSQACDPARRLTGRYAMQTPAGAPIAGREAMVTGLYRSSNRRWGSSLAQRCSLAWISSTRRSAEYSPQSSGSPVFTGGLLAFRT